MDPLDPANVRLYPQGGDVYLWMLLFVLLCDRQRLDGSSLDTDAI
jgi:hypothetical protein